jgi:pimeloyl-ACP methyl ester carboxylesterase
MVAVLAAMIATRNYRAAHSLVEADPPAPVLATPEATGISGLQNVSFLTRDQLRLGAWYRAPNDGAVVIVTHGTNSDRSSMLPELRLLTQAGFGILAFDWPGLGTSQGTIRWDGQARRALTAAIDWVSTQPGVDAARIGGLSFSIGANLMTEVAGQDPRLRAVVLEAPAPAFADYMHLHFTRWHLLSEWPARWAVRNSGLLETGFDPIRFVAGIAPRPVLILGGTEDGEISPELVMKLYAAAREPKALWIVPGAHHGGYSEAASEEYKKRITEFLAQGLGKIP